MQKDRLRAIKARLVGLKTTEAHGCLVPGRKEETQSHITLRKSAGYDLHLRVIRSLETIESRMLYKQDG